MAQISLPPTILTSPGARAPQKEQRPRKSNPVPPSGLTGTVPHSPSRWHLPFPALFFMNPLIEPQQAFQVGQPHPLTPRGGSERAHSPGSQERTPLKSCHSAGSRLSLKPAQTSLRSQATYQVRWSGHTVRWAVHTGAGKLDPGSALISAGACGFFPQGPSAAPSGLSSGLGLATGLLSDRG